MATTGTEREQTALSRSGSNAEGVARLRTFLGERIARFKVPATIWFRTEQLPRNANGKFLKRELRETLDVSAAG